MFGVKIAKATFHFYAFIHHKMKQMLLSIVVNGKSFSCLLYDTYFTSCMAISCIFTVIHNILKRYF